MGYKAHTCCSIALFTALGVPTARYSRRLLLLLPYPPVAISSLSCNPSAPFPTLLQPQYLRILRLLHPLRLPRLPTLVIFPSCWYFILIEPLPFYQHPSDATTLGYQTHLVVHATSRFSFRLVCQTSVFIYGYCCSRHVTPSTFCLSLSSLASIFCYASHLLSCTITPPHIIPIYVPLSSAPEASQSQF